MKLSEYIIHIGVPKASELFGVSDVTIRAWRNLESIPAPAKANEIVKLTHSLVSWEKIYQPYFDNMSAMAAE